VRSERFTIRRCLGEGGMGVVYEAYDKERRAAVALKTLRSFDAGAVTRFKREFRSLQGLAHRNLVALDELFCEDGTWFFTMELLDGEDFLSWVKGEPVHSPFASTIRANLEALGDRARVAVPEAVTNGYDEERLRRGLRQLFEGLSALHAADRVHRDVKPSNVFVTREGRVVLLDFGLVTDVRDDDHRSAANVVGTPEYMAPEQAATREVGPAADVYAVGVMLYEILTGKIPFAGAPLAILMDKQAREPESVESIAPRAPHDLAALCTTLLRFDPDQRPSAAAAARSLATPSVRPAPLDRTPSSGGSLFVGRGEELLELRDAFDSCSSGELESVLVCGESGIGKSAMVRHFTTELAAEQPSLIVLEGRCYEREAVPYKALDGIVDALARHLSRLPETEVGILLPTRSALLARMFPVMLHVPLVAKAHASMALDVEPLDLRRRALFALRELLARVASRYPTVVVIDDLQWADNEGLRALAEILQPPDPPALLLVGTVRSTSAAPEVGSAGFERVRAAFPKQTRVIELERLASSEARELARAVLGRVHAAGTDPDVVADEAGGHPLFVEELARHLALGGSAGNDVKLDDAIYSRIEQLETPTREMAELIAIAGMPIPQEVVATAARLEAAEFTRRTSMLRAANIVRTRGARWADAIEPYHDRVREAVLAHLDRSRRRALHEALALALEAPTSQLDRRPPTAHGDAWASSQRDPETLALHWREAGNAARAARYAQIAGDQAWRAVAFDRAAEWYEQALELSPGDAASELALRVKLGDALASAGRGALAAAEFELAAESSAPGKALELRLRSADQLLRSGHFDRGIAVSRAVLAAVGMRLPSTSFGAILILLYYRFRLFVRGFGFRERDEADVPSTELMRIDACWSIGMALMFVDTGVGFLFLTRALLLALDAGELKRIVRCVGMETGVVGAAGGLALKRIRRLIDLTERLAEQSGSPECSFFALGPAGGALFCCGLFHEGADHIERSLAVLEDRSVSLVHERMTMRIFLINCFRFIGRYRDLRRRQREWLEDARARGDLYGTVELTVGNAAFSWLAEDRPDLAEQSAREVMSRWSTSGFHLEHMHDIEGRVHALLYTGDVAEAHEIARELWARTKRSLLWRIQIVRISIFYLNAGAALCLLGKGLGDRKQLLRQARACARALERERTAWCVPLASVVHAGLALHTGARDEALRRLDAAARDLLEQGLGGYALAARDRAARLRGESAAEELARVAEAWQAEGVVSPERMSRMLVPGFVA
jgi:eukaryotic-like serine/threonine-protein kinase